MNSAAPIDFSTPIVSGAGSGVKPDGTVDACFVQRGWLHAFLADHPELTTVRAIRAAIRKQLDGSLVPAYEPTFSPVIRAFGVSLNDHLPDDKRQRLAAFEERLTGSRGSDAIEERRAWLCTDWIVRTYAPAWLRKAGLIAEADALATLPELTSSELADAASPIITAAKEKAAWAARDAWDAWAARDARAAWAAWAARAAWAAWAAWDAWAAWAARDARAAWAARDARDARAAWAAGSDSVLAIGYAAAKGKPSYDEARAAAEAALAETTEELEESLFALLEAMFAVGEAVAA